ncbi:MAG: MarC family protein [Pseudomonadales bacterium]|nr:MarC family protein [Pseudomonadales bacterium]
MNDFLPHLLSVFIGFLAIMNPIANTAVFVGLTAELSPVGRKRAAFKALMIAFFVIVVFSLLGRFIFDLFGITLPALRITGGILVFLIGYQMVQGNSSKMHHPQVSDTNEDTENDDQDVAISPLAVPILAGPGTIATAMNYSAEGGAEVFITIGAFAVLCGLSYLCFIAGPRLLSLLGKSGITIVTRLMGLILAVVGMQMLLVGIFSAIKQFST